MPYNLNNFDGRAFTTIEDGVVDRQLSSSLNFVGKDVTGYGEIQNENFLYLLENFAGQNAPVNKLQGQIWFDKTSSVMKPKIWDGSQWKTFSIIAAQGTEPINSQLGEFWFDTVNEQLYVKNSSTFSLVGPEAVPGFDRTQLKSVSILDTGSAEHACMVMYADGNIVGVISFDSFDVKSTESIYALGIIRVGRGITLINGAEVGTDTIYAAPAVNETIAGDWTFSSSSGISIGSSRLYTTSSNFYIESLSDVILNANNILPYGTTVLGSANNKFSKVFTGELIGGTSLSTVNMTGQFTLGASSKLLPATDGAIALGANNAKWSSVFTKALNAGGTASIGNITGDWRLEGNSILDVTQGTFTSNNLTTGGATNPGTITGAWNFSNDSSLTLETGGLTLDTGNINVTDGTVLTKKISSGDISTLGTLTGDWNLFSGSQFNATQGTFRSRSLNAGAAATTATITGNWSLTANSILDVTNGSLRSRSLTTGNASTSGDMVGYWQLGAGSSLDVRNGTLYTTTLDTNGATGTINGDWRLTSGKTLNVTSGTFRSTSLNAGSTTAPGTITGNWSVAGSLSATNMTVTAMTGTTVTFSNLRSVGTNTNITRIDNDPNLATNSDSTLATQKAIKAYIDQAISSALSAVEASVPPGTIFYTAGFNIPPGFFRCDGRVLQKSQYPALWAAISTLYGPSTATTFTIPDLRGLFIRVLDEATGRDPAFARTVGSIQQPAIQSHTHLFPGDDQLGNANGVANWVASSAGGFGYDARSVLGGGGQLWETTYAGEGETRPINMALAAIIKY